MLYDNVYFLPSVLLVLNVLYSQVLKEDSVFVVTSRRSTLDKCRLPVGISYSKLAQK
jgi:serine palmitoyltransferase